MAQLLDLLEAITEARVANPHLKPSTLAAFRLAHGMTLLAAARLVVVGMGGQVREIISHGDPGQGEDQDRVLVEQVLAAREVVAADSLRAAPLLAGRRILAVLITEGADEGCSRLLGEMCAQWCAVHEAVQVEKAELIDENHQLREELRAQIAAPNVVAVSGGFRRVLESARRVAASSATVLVHGETGTGKELVARLIHEHSPRSNRPFVAVNCGALSESLLESELFGHVKGAFTGAVADRKGRFEAAEGGTIFLDEIGEISPGMQVRLLRVLQEMEIERVGDTKTRKLDVRVVAATNRVLEDEVKTGRFRADLYYRLNVVYLAIPPLRQRREDVPHLVELFINQHCRRNAKYIEAVAPAVMEALLAYPWPGNVRELENCVEKMVVMAPGRELTTDLLPIAINTHDRHQERDAAAAGLGNFEDRLQAWMLAELHRCLDQGASDLYDRVQTKFERHLFEVVLDHCRNNKSKAGEILGITRNTLAIKLKDMSSERRDWKA